MRSLSERPNPDRWPAFVLPRPDELLSSWLLRTAHAHQMKAHSFCRAVWPKLSFWNRDIDRMALPIVWQTMANKTGVSFERSYQTTLASYEGYLFKHQQYKGNNLWLMPLGIYHRERTRYGVQVCPHCLKNDGSYPYYRRWWRLSLAVACPHCGTELLDACPQCSRSIVFHRSEIGRKNELATYSLSCCAYCQTDLASCKALPANQTLLNYQRQWYDHVNSITYSNNGHEYFDVLHHLLMMLSSQWTRYVQFQRVICQMMKTVHQLPVGGYINRFENLRVGQRRLYLNQAGWLLDRWPERFIAVAKESKTWWSFIVKDGPHLPNWFLDVLRSNLTYVP